MTPAPPPHIALIGFSEAGRAFAAGLSGEGARITAADLRAREPAFADAARALKVPLTTRAADAARDADIVFSLVTASAATAVAAEAAAWLRPGQTFVDLNSTGPADKQAAADAVAASGADFVEGAVMSPVAGLGHRTPVLLAGPAAAALADRLSALGMEVAVAGDRFGAASAAKMCRSVVMKGIEAIVTESLLAARAWDVDDLVLDSLAETYPGIDWPERSCYLLTRVLEHGRRRAAEMRQAAGVVRDAGYPGTLSAAIAELMDWTADRTPEDGFGLDGDHRALADRLARAATARR